MIDADLIDALRPQNDVVVQGLAFERLAIAVRDTLQNGAVTHILTGTDAPTQLTEGAVYFRYDAKGVLDGVWLGTKNNTPRRVTGFVGDAQNRPRRFFRWPTAMETITLASHGMFISNVSIAHELRQRGWDSTNKVEADFVIDGTIGSVRQDLPALHVETLPAGSKINITLPTFLGDTRRVYSKHANSSGGAIVGCGGRQVQILPASNLGAHKVTTTRGSIYYNTDHQGFSKHGGTALRIDTQASDTSIRIENNGLIAGGGGAGNGFVLWGDDYHVRYSKTYDQIFQGGAGREDFLLPANSDAKNTNNLGGYHESLNTIAAYAAGGDFGKSGQTITEHLINEFWYDIDRKGNSYVDRLLDQPAGQGGAAVSGNQYATWIKTGTRRGRVA